MGRWLALRGSAAWWRWLLLLATACGGPSYQHLVERSLPAAEGLVCSGYLAWNEEPVRDVFLVINGSGTLSNAFVHPTFERVMSTNQVGYATYDKPGIQAPFNDPAALRRDAALLERYTLGHGITCATGALRWAREQFGPAVRLHVRAHSEGTLVTLYAYEALLDTDAATANAIETLVLSGLALEPFDQILERQLAAAPRGAEWRRALGACDWAELQKHGGVSCAYVEDAARRPSGRSMFERLAARTPGVRLHVFHGTSDWNTPVGPVRELEAWNAAQGHLRVQFHYYDGGHNGSDAARAELAQLLLAIVSD
jgi:hypothetical protein